MSKLSICFLLVTAQIAYCQNAPTFNVQINLDDVTKVYNTSYLSNWVVQGGDYFTWIDSQSKMQFGSSYYIENNSMAPNNNKVLLLSEDSFLIMHPTEIVLVQRGKENQVIYEPKDKNYVINISFFDAERKQLLIHTKSLEHLKENEQSFVKIVGDHYVYDITSDCELLVLDLKSKSILQRNKINKQLTALNNFSNGNLYAGTFEGELIVLKKDLSWEKIKNISNKPIHSIHALKEGVYVLQHKEKKFLQVKADGIIFYLNKEQKVEKAELPTQVFQSKPNALFQLTPTNEIKTSFTNKDSTSLYVGFGFDAIAELSYGNLELPSYYKDSTQRQTGYFGFTNFGKSILTLENNMPHSPFNTSSQLGTINYTFGQFRPFFIRPDEILRANSVQKVYDKEGNYHYITNLEDNFAMKKRSEYLIYSSNKTHPTKIKCNGSLLLQDTIFYFSEAYIPTLTIGSLDLSQLDKEEYVLRFVNGAFSDEVFGEDLPFIEVKKTYSNKIFQLNYQSPEGPKVVYTIDENTKLFTFVERTGKNYDKLSTKVVIIDNRNRSVLYSGSFPYSVFSDPLPSLNSQYFTVINEHKKSSFLEIWDWKKAEKIFSKKLPEDKLSSVNFCFNGAGDKLYFSTVNEDWQTSVSYVDLTKEVLESSILMTVDRVIYNFKLNEAKKLLGYSTADNVVVQNYENQKVLFARETIGKDQVGIDKNGFTFNKGASFIIWNFKGDYIQFIPFENNGSVEILNGEKFKLTKNALNNIAFVHGNQILQAKRYESYVNDPLSVLTVNGSTNYSYHNVLKSAQEKRMNRNQNNSLTDLFVAESKCGISNIKSIPDHVQDSLLPIVISCSSKAGIKSLHVSINGVPLYSKNGLAYKNHPRSINDTLQLKLSTGINKIEVSFLDTNEMIVYAPLLTVEATYSSPEKMYYLGIGIDKYIAAEHNLKWCKKDIMDLSAKLSEKYSGDFILDTLFNENVTLKNLLKVRKRLEKIGVNDKLVISYSGHGVLDSVMNYYIATHDIDFEYPVNNGFLYSDFESLIDGLEVRKRLIMIDACHSGIVDTASFNLSNHKSDELALKGAVRVQVSSGNKIKEATSFELMHELFYAMENDLGATIISAAAGNQFAYEKNGLENGVFTFSVLELLNSEEQIFVNDLERAVGERVINLSNGLQKPTSRKVNTDYNWSLLGE